MPTGSDSTDGEKRKRGNSEVDSEEESNALSRNKKTVRTPVKSKQKNEDKLDRVLEMLQQLTLDVNQIKLEQSKTNKEFSEMRVENEQLRKENNKIKEENCMIKKEIQSINTRLEQLEKEKRRNNIVRLRSVGKQ